jgi:DNA-directed RNA polymerase specialized sigma subunit
MSGLVLLSEHDGKERTQMFGSARDVVKALEAFRDHYDPRSGSVMIATTKATDIDADPFRRGFIETLDVRSELLRKLAVLDERTRAVVLLWYVKDLPVAKICETLTISRSHCYRLRDRALATMLDPIDEIREASA